VIGKRQSREIALQILFAWDAACADDDVMAVRIAEEATQDGETRSQAIEWARGAWANRELLDARIEKIAPQWPPRRQPAVDRNIIRLAAHELTAAPTPPKVVIDEAIELAKQYSTENSPSFVNGVLDALLREHQGVIATEPPAQERTE
jgi:N utilization substance protein B